MTAKNPIRHLIGPIRTIAPIIIPIINDIVITTIVNAKIILVILII